VCCVHIVRRIGVCVIHGSVGGWVVGEVGMVCRVYIVRRINVRDPWGGGGCRWWGGSWGGVVWCVHIVRRMCVCDTWAGSCSRIISSANA
jgi:hypothetical protein